MPTVARSGEILDGFRRLWGRLRPVLLRHEPKVDLAGHAACGSGDGYRPWKGLPRRLDMVKDPARAQG